MGEVADERRLILTVLLAVLRWIGAAVNEFRISVEVLKLIIPGLHCISTGIASSIHLLTLVAFLAFPQVEHGWQGSAVLFLSQWYPFTQVPVHRLLSSLGEHSPTDFSWGWHILQSSHCCLLLLEENVFLETQSLQAIVIFPVETILVSQGCTVPYDFSQTTQGSHLMNVPLGWNMMWFPFGQYSAMMHVMKHARTAMRTRTPTFYIIEIL